MIKVVFQVYGIPQTKGSTRAFIRQKGEKAYPVITNDNPKNKPWASTVAAAAQATRQNSGLTELITGPVTLDLVFVLPKPKSYPKTRELPMTKKPDLDKMTRSIKDALQGVFYKNDSQVNECHLYKQYGDEPGVKIELRG